MADEQTRLTVPAVVLLGCAVACAAGIRVIAATGDLWFDEIWSIRNAVAASGVRAILFDIRQDNNHWLTSVYLWLIGDGATALSHRGLSLATGIGTVLLVTLEGMRRGGRSAVTVALLFAFSYILIHFDSEARGYGPAVFFGLASYFSLSRLFAGGRAMWGVTFALAATLGILSQLTFSWVYTGFFIWTVSATRHRKVNLRGLGGVPPTAQIALLHSLPSIVLAVLLWFDVRKWTVGGSGPTELSSELANLTAYTFGLRGPDWAVLGLGACILGILGAEIIRSKRRRDPEAFLFLTVLIAGPMAFLLVMSGHFFYPRYVVVSVPFALLLLARFLDRQAAASVPGRHLRIAFLTLFVAGNLLHVASFMGPRRGDYSGAIEHLVASSDEGDIPVALLGGSFQDPVIEFYARRVEGGDRVRIVRPNEVRENSGDEHPKWVLVQVLDTDRSPPRDRVVLETGVFSLDRRFPNWGAAGWTWDLYRAIEPL